MKYLFTIENKSGGIKKVKRGYLIEAIDHLKAFMKVQNRLSEDPLPLNEQDFTVELIVLDTFEVL